MAATAGLLSATPYSKGNARSSSLLLLWVPSYHGQYQKGRITKGCYNAVPAL